MKSLRSMQSRWKNAAVKKGHIVKMSDGHLKKYNGTCWRYLCSHPGCMKEKQKLGFCASHLGGKERSRKLYRDKEIVVAKILIEMSGLQVNRVPTVFTDRQTPRFSIHRRYNGKQWIFLCAYSQCKQEIHQPGFCAMHVGGRPLSEEPRTERERA